MSTNFQYSFMKYEDCKNDTVYTITLNPKNEYQYFTNEDRKQAFFRYHKNYIQKLTFLTKPIMTNIFTTELYMEISPTGRLHFHGTIKILNKHMFYIHVLYKLQDMYSYEIDHLTDPVIWTKYCLKQQPFYDKMEVGHDFKRMTKDFYTANALDNI